MSSKNCLKCVHFYSKMVFEYHNELRYITKVNRVMGCYKLGIEFKFKNSEEKNNEKKYIANKCINAKYFKQIPKINIEEIIVKEV